MYKLLSGKHVGQPDDGCDDEDDFEVTDAIRIAKRDEKAERKKVKEAKKASTEANGEGEPDDDLNNDHAEEVGAEQLTKEENKAKKAKAKKPKKTLAKGKGNAPPITDEPEDDVEMEDVAQNRDPSPAPMDIDTEPQTAEPAQPQPMDIDDEDIGDEDIDDEESAANRDHASLLPGDGFNGDNNDGDGFNGTASAPPTDEEPSGPNSDQENPSDDDEYNDSNGVSKPLVNQCERENLLFGPMLTSHFVASSPDLNFLLPSNAKSPMAGDRRRRGPLPGKFLISIPSPYR